ncbi:MAG: YfcE family phosphodiesterase [Clostridiales bacterium]|nr:YfcE family phosphodiesterase [Clostridiales bacterium]
MGDYIGDARKLHTQIRNVVFYMVKGNCDFSAAGETEQLIKAEGVLIYMTHGHKYNVKNGLTAFSYRTQEVGADIGLYGHTHKAMIQQSNGIWLMNPGQMERHDDMRKATYGVITIENDNIRMEIVNL